MYKHIIGFLHSWYFTDIFDFDFFLLAPPLDFFVGMNLQENIFTFRIMSLLYFSFVIVLRYTVKPTKMLNEQKYIDL